ncbi:hypothetical protein NW756_010039 [Fusarium oxysporum]|uniref:Uncharacterized protein n=1 Tax=Fusarium oxysporum f. sp. raphani TaxID=96318 RepID=A0A8J5TUT2_FUSOX|nr:hypothetical protein Forpi1262_v017402 [Fusarium oxysporum f. sp. raphani]KAJ4082350.1 hypothetical protein NW756_010039 [Fusarium oxysporum]KAJ4108516.1 hypothetical protein NW769_008444 [Fusarium oxysporum]
MRFYQIAPLGLWVGKGAASGSQLFHDTFQLNKLPDMVSLADAKLKDIVLPDSISEFTEWIGGIPEPQAFGLQPRQRQCVDAGYSVSDAVLKVAPASPAGAVEVMPNNAAQADVTIHHHRFVAVAAQLVSKVKPVSVEVAAAAVRPSAALLDAITRTPRFVAEVSVGTAPRDMTACQVEGVVHPARSAVVIASVITHERPLAVPDLELFGPVQSPCCENGSCLKGTTCCDKECCRSNGYCASDGYCKLCPAATKTIKSTDTVTTTKMKTVRVTTDIEPDTGNAPEFTCVPMTATNDEGATLELDEGCTLHYEPPEATTTDNAAARLRRDAATAPAHVNRGHGLLARQASCTPYTTVTRTEWETETETETGTKTITVQGEDATFSCPEMEVTNDVGDTLALDAECVLSFTPAETTSSEEGASAQDRPTDELQVPAGTGEESTTTVTATAGSGGSNDNSGAIERASLSLMLSFAGVAMFVLVN